MRYNSESVSSILGGNTLSFEATSNSIRAKSKSTMNWLLQKIIGDDMPSGIISSCEIGERGLMKLIYPLFMGLSALAFIIIGFFSLAVIYGSIVLNINNSRAATIGAIFVVSLFFYLLNSPVMDLLVSWASWEIRVLSRRMSVLGLGMMLGIVLLIGYSYLYIHLDVTDIPLPPILDMVLRIMAAAGLTLATALVLILSIGIPVKVITFTYKHTLGVPKKIKIVVPGGDTVEKTYPFYKWLAIKMHLCTVFAN